MSTATRIVAYVIKNVSAGYGMQSDHEAHLLNVISVSFLT